MVKVVVPLLLPSGVVVGHLTIILLGVLELLQGDVLGNYEVALVVLAQDSRLEEAVHLRLDNVLLLHLLGQAPVHVLQGVILGQLGLNQLLLSPCILPVRNDLLLAPSSLGVLLHKVHACSMIDCKNRSISILEK